MAQSLTAANATVNHRQAVVLRLKKDIGLLWCRRIAGDFFDGHHMTRKPLAQRRRQNILGINTLDLV
jgi:hypothetical protein